MAMRPNGRGTDREPSENGRGFADQSRTIDGRDASRLYFIRAGRMRAVKIGIARDPDARLAALQTASHHQLHLIGHAPGGREAEQDWHDRFRSLRMRGEWFQLTLDLRDAINQHLFETKGAVRYIFLSVVSPQSAAHSVRQAFSA